jgi:hypothetical protein
MHTKEYAKQLADSKEKNAEQAAEINALKQQMQQLTTMLAEQNVQGAPTLVETELPTPKIREWFGLAGSIGRIRHPPMRAQWDGAAGDLTQTSWVFQYGRIRGRNMRALSYRLYR